uniref:Glucuronosyltransferase n=1 Tax=Cercocebus atys TaxID=9531 RepID=A0A2K5KK94_CERAT
MSVKWTSVILLIQLSFYFSSGSCGKVLVWAAEYSHWMNMKTILEELVQRGHEVTVLASSASILFDPNNSSALKIEVFPTSLTKTEFENIAMQEIKRWLELPKDTFWLYFSQMQEIMWRFGDIIRNFCKDVVSNKKLMKKLQESRFDVVFGDAIFPCSELLAELFNIPLVYSLRFTPGYNFEKHCGGFVFPPSYVPVVMSELSDQMTFMERIKNMIYMLSFDFYFQMYDMKKWDQFYSEVLGRPTTLSETMGKADIWLIRNSWNFQFPHPLLPNVDFVGGLHCKPAKPLPKEMEEFVQSSGENGVVVFSLGSMVTNMKEERANVIASALAQIPQKVLWRFDGKKPDTLGLNTRLYKWIPQNDLLYKENVMKLSRIQHDQPVKPLDRAVFWIEFVMRHKGAKHLRPAAHDLTWFQYHSLDVIGFLLACVATVIFVIMKCLFCFWKFVRKGKKGKSD